MDLRRWDAGRPTMRNPDHPEWPERGERTQYEDVAEEWAWDYLRLFQRRERRRQIGQPEPLPTLGDAIRRWLRHRESTVSEGTLITDRTATNHLKDRFGTSIRLGSLTSARMQRMVDDMSAAGYKATTLRNYHTTMQAFFRYYGAASILEDVTLPDPGEMDPRAWSDAELETLREAADGLGEWYRLLLEVGIGTGGRRNELCGLRWSDFHPTRKTVRFERQARRHSRRMKPLKGKRARTAMVLPSWWSHHRAADGYVLGEKRDQVVYRSFLRILDAADLNEAGVGVHSMRHTYARIFMEAGGSLEELQRFLGHASVTTTEQRYGHFGDEAAVRLARGKFYG